MPWNRGIHCNLTWSPIIFFFFCANRLHALNITFTNKVHDVFIIKKCHNQIAMLINVYEKKNFNPNNKSIKKVNILKTPYIFLVSIKLFFDDKIQNIIIIIKFNIKLHTEKRGTD